MEQNKSYLAFSLSFIALLAIFVLALSGITATFKTGSSAESLQTSYAPGEELDGWINISLTNEAYNSLISTIYSPTAEQSTTTVKNLLDLNKAPYNCSTVLCGMTYASVDAGEQTKSFVLNEDESELIGLKISDEDYADEITNFTFKLSSDAGTVCENPLIIDILDKNSTDTIWSSSKASGEYVCEGESKYGSYESAHAHSTPATLSSYAFCNKVNLSAFPDIKIGAKLAGSGLSYFRMTISSLSEDNAFDDTCIFSASSSGEHGCAVNQSSNFKAEYYVCISQINGTEYEINYDTHDAVGYWEGEDENDLYDWEIFTLQSSYAPIVSTMINNTAPVGLIDYILIYIEENYNYDCSDDCFIPVRITSYLDNQHINLSNGLVKYPSGPGFSTDINFYDLTSSASKISAAYTKLYLNGSGLKAPLTAKNYNLSLKLGSSYIVTKKLITVLNLPLIEYVFPQEVPAAIDTEIQAEMSGGNATLFRWNFNDNTSVQETTTSYTTHKFSNIGTYVLILTAVNSQGETSKNFSIKVVSPKDYINSTIANYKSRLSSIRSKLNTFPSPVRSYLERSLNLTNIEISLTSLQLDFNNAGNNSQSYIAIANELSSISLPNSVNITDRANGKFVANPETINSGDVKTLTSSNSSASDSLIKTAIFSWITKSLDVDGNLTVYSGTYSSSVIPLVSYIKIKVNPMPGASVGSIYAIINKPQAGFEAGTGISGLAYTSNAAGFLLDMSSGYAKEFEFLIPGGVSFLDMPLYFSPSLDKLGIVSEIGVCNFNGECQKDLGEDSDNCRSDCKPWGKAVFWIIFALFIVFCLYIAAQEWYKRYYENYLFKDKNDLFNLVHFIDNAEKQGMTREDIFQKLGEKGWHNEQLVYAYKKFKGERTGMWEIPIFRLMERKKVQSELELRKKIGINPNVAPKPIKPFTPKNQAAKPAAPPQKPIQTAQPGQQQASQQTLPQPQRTVQPAQSTQPAQKEQPKAPEKPVSGSGK